MPLSSDDVDDSCGVGLRILVHLLQIMGCVKSPRRFLARCLYLAADADIKVL